MVYIFFIKAFDILMIFSVTFVIILTPLISGAYVCLLLLVFYHTLKFLLKDGHDYQVIKTEVIRL